MYRHTSNIKNIFHTEEEKAAAAFPTHKILQNLRKYIQGVEAKLGIF